MNGLRRSSWVFVGLVVLGPLAGCKGLSQKRSASIEPGMTTASPTLGAPVEPGGTVVAAAPSTGESWTTRHPLFSRPKHYYDSTQSNKAVKAGVATVVGIPAGIFGEMKQIVTGTPAEPKY